MSKKKKPTKKPNKSGQLPHPMDATFVAIGWGLGEGGRKTQVLID